MMPCKFIITLCYDEIGKKENMVEFVCIKNSYSISILDVPNEHECEVLWAVINSRRLQRGYGKLVIGVLYHPPGANKSLMLWNTCNHPWTHKPY